MEHAAKEERTYANGAIIFKQGTHQPEMYAVLQGKVGIYADYGTPQEKKLTELSAGGLFGEMGVIECYPRSATAVALDGETKLQVITAETLSAYFREKPEKIIAIMRTLGTRIRELSREYLEACHAVAESVEAEKKGVQKSGWMKTQLKKLADAYAAAAKAAAEYGGDLYGGYPGTWL